MKIVINEQALTLELTKEDGTIVDSCNYKNILDDDYTFEDLKRDNDDFNRTLSSFSEFDDIKELGKALKVHVW